MSVAKITKEMFHCVCEREECQHQWDSEVIPMRCPECGSRRWNRPAPIGARTLLSFQGKTQGISAWARDLGLNRHRIQWRHKQGWPIEQVLSTEDWRFQK